MKTKTTGPLIHAGQIAVDGTKFPALRRALERGRDLVAKTKDGWAKVAELRRTGQPQAAERLLRDLLGIKGEPMPDDVKAALRAKRDAMTDDEKRAEREKRKADRILKRLAARATGKGIETTNHEEMAMAKKAKKAAVKSTKPAAAPKAKKAKERDPRLPAAGSTITREYEGKQLEVKVLEQGFEFEGAQYPSLTSLALKITGFKAISGPAFFKLDKPQTTEAAK